jgi:hypothetical protein
MMSEAPLLRLGLHPPDLEHAAIWRQITRMVNQFAESRTATTYRDWIAQRRFEIASEKPEVR